MWREPIGIVSGPAPTTSALSLPSLRQDSERRMNTGTSLYFTSYHVACEEVLAATESAAAQSVFGILMAVSPN